jgi:hypothetical protein
MLEAVPAVRRGRAGEPEQVDVKAIHQPRLRVACPRCLCVQNAERSRHMFSVR